MGSLDGLSSSKVSEIASVLISCGADFEIVNTVRDVYAYAITNEILNPGKKGPYKDPVTVGHSYVNYPDALKDGLKVLSNHLAKSPRYLYILSYPSTTSVIFEKFNFLVKNSRGYFCLGDYSLETPPSLGKS